MLLSIMSLAHVLADYKNSVNIRVSCKTYH